MKKEVGCKSCDLNGTHLERIQPTSNPSLPSQLQTQKGHSTAEQLKFIWLGFTIFSCNIILIYFINIHPWQSIVGLRQGWESTTRWSPVHCAKTMYWFLKNTFMYVLKYVLLIIFVRFGDPQPHLCPKHGFEAVPFKRL